MATIDRDLVRAINSGRCFALVGSGPSCEVGLPSWKMLAKNAIASLDPATHQSEIKRCEKLLLQMDYPAVFSVVEKVNGLNALLDIIKKTLSTSCKKETIYKYVACWPFSTYLTTNYDDYLSEYLRGENQTFITKYNTKEDFRVLRSDSKGLIFKIHGDCNKPNDIVLTKEQYDAFRKSDSRRYWREKIRSALHMVNIVLFGYSANDPDFKDQLERAKDIVSPDHPIFMFATDIPVEDVRRYYNEFNIRIISYTNNDGTHRELHRVLKRYDPFIAKRNSPHIGQYPIDEEKAQIASSIYLYTLLNLANGNNSCMRRSYEALIVGCLGYYDPNVKVSLKELQTKLAEKLHVRYIDPHSLAVGLEKLYSRGLIEISPNLEEYSLSVSGIKALETTKAECKLRKEKFTESCLLFLNKEYPKIDKIVRNEVIHIAERGLRVSLKIAVLMC